GERAKTKNGFWGNRAVPLEVGHPIALTMDHSTIFDHGDSDARPTRLEVGANDVINLGDHASVASLSAYSNHQLLPVPGFGAIRLPCLCSKLLPISFFRPIRSCNPLVVQ